MRWGQPLSPGAHTWHRVLGVPVLEDHDADCLRCIHPDVVRTSKFSELLGNLARRRGRTGVEVLAGRLVAHGLKQSGFSEAAVIPGYYHGEEEGVLLRMSLGRKGKAPWRHRAVNGVRRLLRGGGGGVPRPPVETRQAHRGDAWALTHLWNDAWPPSAGPERVDPRRMETWIQEGGPWRVVGVRSQLVASASTRLDHTARAAEIVGCITRPGFRGRGYMQAVVRALTIDLERAGFVTAFAVVPADLPAANLVFQRNGFRAEAEVPRFQVRGGKRKDARVWVKAL